MEDKSINCDEKIYEIYTCSGKRINVKACNAVAFNEIGDLIFYDTNGEPLASFQLANIEGWRIAQ